MASETISASPGEGPAASRGKLRVARPACSAQLLSTWRIKRFDAPETDIHTVVSQTRAATSGRRARWSWSRMTVCRHGITPSSFAGIAASRARTPSPVRARSRLQARCEFGACSGAWSAECGRGLPFGRGRASEVTASRGPFRPARRPPRLIAVRTGMLSSLSAERHISVDRRRYAETACTPDDR